MRKVIKHSDKTRFISDLISTLCTLRKINLSDSESATLLKLITYSNNNSLTLDTQLSKQIKEELAMNQSLFSTVIFRLEQKECITKQGKTINLNPVFHKINECSEIVIRLDSSPEKDYCNCGNSTSAEMDLKGNNRCRDCKKLIGNRD